MALGTVTYLNTGAISLAAAHWTDATGIVDEAWCVISSGNQSIQTGLTPGSISAGIGILDILEGFSGDIGGSGGSLALETNNSLYDQATAIGRIRYWASGGSFYYTAQGAGGATDKCHIFQQKGGGRAVLTGTYTQRSVHLESGTLNIAQNVASESGYRWDLLGGSATIQYSATGFHTVRALGGSHTIQRGAQTGLYIGGNASATIDAQGGTYALCEMSGGSARWLNSGTITACNAFAGVLDFSGLQRPLTITTLVDGPACRIIPSKLLTIGTRHPIGTGAQGLT